MLAVFETLFPKEYYSHAKTIYSRFSHISPVTWLDFYSGATLLIRTFEWYRMIQHSWNRVTWPGRYERFYCSVEWRIFLLTNRTMFKNGKKSIWKLVPKVCSFFNFQMVLELFVGVWKWKIIKKVFFCNGTLKMSVFTVGDWLSDTVENGSRNCPGMGDCAVHAPICGRSSESVSTKPELWPR